MGAHWLRFRVRPGVDPQSVRELENFVSEQYPHGHWVLPHPNLSEEAGVRARWELATQELDELLELPSDDLDGLSSSPPYPPPSKIGHVSLMVISRNCIFPLEWRDDALRTVFPEELPECLYKWRRYHDEIRAGLWQRYLHELYHCSIVNDPYNEQVAEDLILAAQRSESDSAEWACSAEVAALRSEILEFNEFQRIKDLQAKTPIPNFLTANRQELAPAELENQLQEVQTILSCLHHQVLRWNHSAPTSEEVRNIVEWTYAEFLDQVNDDWTQEFFNWCDYLVSEGYGLHLWA